MPGFFLALGPGAPRARPGFTRRVLAFTIPAGVAAAAATLASYALVSGGPGASVTARTAALLAVFAVGLWVLALVAGRPTPGRVVLVAAMAAGLVPLLAAPLARRFLALQLPSAAALAAETVVVLAAGAALTLWRRSPRSAGHCRPPRPRPGAPRGSAPMTRAAVPRSGHDHPRSCANVTEPVL